MIIIHRDGLSLNGAFYPKEVCIQFYPHWDWEYDEIGIHNGVLYGKRGSTQLGINEKYRSILSEIASHEKEMKNTIVQLDHAKADNQKFARENPIIHVVKSIFGADGPSLVRYGNVWVRRWWWKKGETLDGHKHNFDHLALLYRGSAKVTVDDVETTYHAPMEIIITREKTHFVTALEDNTVWMCVFAVRDEAGEVDIYGEANNPASHT